MPWNDLHRDGWIDEWGVFHEANPPDMGYATAHVPVRAPRTAPEAAQGSPAVSDATPRPPRPSLRLLPPPDVVQTEPEAAEPSAPPPPNVRGLRALLRAMRAAIDPESAHVDDVEAADAWLHGLSRQRLESEDDR